MKALILSLSIAVFGIQAFATSIDHTEVLASATINKYDVKSVALLADARLQVVNFNGEVATHLLSNLTLTKLSQDINSLSDAELKVEVRETICLFFRAPYSPTLSVTNAAPNSPSLRLVMTAKHCGLHEITYPTNEYQEIIAHKLIEQLLILAIELNN